MDEVLEKVEESVAKEVFACLLREGKGKNDPEVEKKDNSLEDIPKSSVRGRLLPVECDRSRS